MGVPSLPFLAFAAAAACLFNLFRTPLWRQLVLLVVNLAFLASFVRRPSELVPYAGFLGLGFCLIHYLRGGRPKAMHRMAIVMVLLVFCWLKQYAFVPKALLIDQPYLLVGLSYVFFRVMHLVIDAPEAEGRLRLHIVDYINYTLNYTSIVSGPIQRYEAYHSMVCLAPLGLSIDAIGGAVDRIITGLFKVWVMALATSVLQQQATQGVLSGSTFVGQVASGATLAALFPVYLFFNFSGYTDFVMGVARLFRLQLPENFDRPFTSASFIEYWARWHISLSTWLKTYVYNPLVTVLMRRMKNPTILPYAGTASLFVTFFLIGLWHGQTSEFLVFGLLNGLGIAVNQAFRIVAAKRLGRKSFAALSKRPVYLLIGRGLTFSWVAFTLLWFWADWPLLFRFAQALGLWGSLSVWVVMFVCSSAVLGGLQFTHRIGLSLTVSGQPVLLSRYVRAAWLTAITFLMVGVQSVMGSAAPDIVYKSF